VSIRRWPACSTSRHGLRLNDKRKPIVPGERSRSCSAFEWQGVPAYNAFGLALENGYAQPVLANGWIEDDMNSIVVVAAVRPARRERHLRAAGIVGRRAYHPVRDRLDALQWDGTPRIDLRLTAYLGAIVPRATSAPAHYAGPALVADFGHRPHLSP
jgi:hypothetical protein